MLCKISGFHRCDYEDCRPLGCDAVSCGSCKNCRFGGTYRLHHQVDKNLRARKNVSSDSLHSVLPLIVTANVLSSQILVTLMMVAVRSF
jgi:hypothetical protein